MYQKYILSTILALILVSSLNSLQIQNYCTQLNKIVLTFVGNKLKNRSRNRNINRNIKLLNFLYNNIHRGVYATSGIANGLLTGYRKSLLFFPQLKKSKMPIHVVCNA